MRSPIKKDQRVTADTMLKMSWCCEQGKLHSRLHYERTIASIFEGDEYFFLPFGAFPLKGGCGEAEGAQTRWLHSVSKKSSSSKFATFFKSATKWKLNASQQAQSLGISLPVGMEALNAFSASLPVPVGFVYPSLVV